MSRRDELRREIEAVLDDMSEEAGVGVARAPAPEEVVVPMEEEAGGHDHVGHGMVAFSQWGEDDDGKLVALDPGRFGFWDLEVEERERAERAELAEGGMHGHEQGRAHEAHGDDEMHGHDEGHGRKPAKPRKRKPRASGSDR